VLPEGLDKLKKFFHLIESRTQRPSDSKATIAEAGHPPPSGGQINNGGAIPP
jgi:hypothetical protein